MTPPHPFALAGRAAPVTGGGRGIGAAAMLFLAAPASRHVSGQTLVADGGAASPETGFVGEWRWG
jgi:NAD(P)-dependent dehydrogenase (short-subunit alcohol dehydrogenase family)